MGLPNYMSLTLLSSRSSGDETVCVCTVWRPTGGDFMCLSGMMILFDSNPHDEGFGKINPIENP